MSTARVTPFKTWDAKGRGAFVGQWPEIATAMVCLLMALSPSRVCAAEWHEKVLYSFQGGNDGAVPAGGVVFDKQGNLYGATSEGGTGCTGGSCGTVFQLVPPATKSGKWSENILHNFQGQDGSGPEGGVLVDAAGNVYGATGYGGSGPCTLIGSVVGCGVVYEMVPPKTKNGVWTEKVLYSFLGDKDGQFPVGDLVFDKAGNLYGATQFGGGFGSCDSPYYQHCGTIFELIAPKTKNGKWTEKVLYSFKSVDAGKQIGDGVNPNGGLIFDIKGAMYGTTTEGGFTGGNCPNIDGFVGCGTVFELKPPSKSGGPWIEKMLYRFSGRPNDGSGPNGGLVFDGQGLLYGTTVGGGNQEGGVVFSLKQPQSRDTSWTESLLYQFGSALPLAGLVYDSAGTLYGTTSIGGKIGGGTVFRLRLTSNDFAEILSNLYFFKGSPDGSYPASRMTFDGAGNLYGTTQQSGTGQNCGNLGCGTVYEVWPSCPAQDGHTCINGMFRHTLEYSSHNSSQ